MFIEFSSGPRAGERAHLKYEVAAPLIVAGIAVEVHLTEDLQQRLRFGVPEFVPPVPEWHVINSPHTGKVLIQRRCGTDATLFSGRPGKEWNCPPAIVKEFEARLERERQAREADRQDRDRAAESLHQR